MKKYVCCARVRQLKSFVGLLVLLALFVDIVEIEKMKKNIQKRGNDIYVEELESHLEICY